MAKYPVRSAFLSAVLALLAVCGLVGMSGWHSAMVHDDDPVHAGSVLHRHAETRNDPDAPIHMLAHSVGQWFVDAGVIQVTCLIAVPRIRWTITRDDLLGGVATATLLRPPRH